MSFLLEKQLTSCTTDDKVSIFCSACMVSVMMPIIACLETESGWILWLAYCSSEWRNGVLISLLMWRSGPIDVSTSLKHDINYCYFEYKQGEQVWQTYQIRQETSSFYCVLLSVTKDRISVCQSVKAQIRNKKYMLYTCTKCSRHMDNSCSYCLSFL